MKTAIYIEDGVVQLVITPETKFEKSSMKVFEGKEVEAKLFSGSFYDCRGGWVRQKNYYPTAGSMYSSSADDNSLIIKVKEEERE